MPPERQMPGSPDDWVRRARSDLALAKIPLPEGALYEDLCFHAQQAPGGLCIGGGDLLAFDPQLFALNLS